MEIHEVTGQEYRAIISHPYHAFNTAEFNLLNKCKCDDVSFVLFKDTKYHMGLVCGVKDGVLSSPFSAPYGGFSYLRRDLGIAHIDRAVEALLEFSHKKRIARITLTLPPTIYDTSFISKMVNCLFRHGFTITSVEVNHVLDLGAAGSQNGAGLSRHARRLLRIASTHGMMVRCCDMFDDKRLAYAIIERHKRQHGYPLKMTWEQVKETMGVIEADFFVMTDSCSREIASAIVFQTQRRNIAQVVYWGDIREHAPMGTMDCLALEIYKHYKREGFRYIDLGPSSEGSVPNYGLCRFKESIGCVAHPKITMVYGI